jgi:uncharacterized protein YbbC (DUF1343 family)
VTDPLTYKPVETQYLLLGMLKSMYPAEFKKALKASEDRKEMFCKVNGTEEVYRILKEKKYVIWELKQLHKEKREEFLALRKQYLLY